MFGLVVKRNILNPKFLDSNPYSILGGREGGKYKYFIEP